MALTDLLKREPRKQVTGTGYTASPAEPVAPQSYSEIGSQYRASLTDPVPEFINRNLALQTYKKMIRSDASVRSSLRAGKAPVLGGDYFVDPFDESEEAMIAKEFVEFNIFNGFQTLSAAIATEMPEAVRGSTHFRTLFLAALVLFGLTFLVNTIAELVRLRFRRRVVQL